MSSEQKPIRICNATACCIRKIARDAMESTPDHKVPPQIIELLKETAVRDQLSHQMIDPNYNLGSGCANPGLVEEESNFKIEGWDESWGRMKGGQCDSTKIS